jgi:hypothetical protein
MRQHGIQSKMSNKFAITTDSNNTLQTTPDRLARQFSVDARACLGERNNAQLVQNALMMVI